MSIEEIKSAGIDYESGLKRFANKPELYHKYLVKFLEDENFTRLGTYLEEGRYGEAFVAAHTLKGMTGNLSMTDFYDEIFKLVEVLRISPTEKEEAEKAKEIYGALCILYQKVETAISTLL